MDFLGGLFSGGLNLIGTAMQNDAAAERQQEANTFNAGQAAINRSFNAQEAEFAREFNRGQAQDTRNFNSAEAIASRQFNQQEASTARDFTAAQAEIARGYNSDQARAQREWTERMSSTAYQRSRADMVAAGLNPILAAGAGGASATGGSTASSGGASGVAASGSAASAGAASGPAASAGGMAHATAAPVRNLFEAGNIATAMEAMRLKPQIENMEQANRNLVQDEHNKKMEEKRIAAEISRTYAEGGRAEAAGRNIEQQTKIGVHQEQAARRAGEYGKVDSDFINSGLGTWARHLGNTFRELIPITSNAKSLQQMINAD